MGWGRGNTFKESLYVHSREHMTHAAHGPADRSEPLPKRRQVTAESKTVVTYIELGELT